MAASKMAASDSNHLADFEQVKILNSYFADFEHIKIFSSHFADFEQVKKTNNKTPVEEKRCFRIFCLGQCLMSPALYPGLSDL